MDDYIGSITFAWDVFKMPDKRKLYNVYDRSSTVYLGSDRTVYNIDYYKTMSNNGWDELIFYETEDGFHRSKWERVRYHSALYHFEPGVDYGDYIHVELLKKIGPWKVVNLNYFFRKVKDGYQGVNTEDMILTVDFRDCDLSGIISIDGMFDDLYIFKGVNVLLPEGRKALAPVTAKGFIGRANILNLKEVFKHIHTELMLSKSFLLSKSNITEFNFSTKGFCIDPDFVTLYSSVVGRGRFVVYGMFRDCKKLKYVKGHINNYSEKRGIDAESLFTDCISLEKVEHGVFKNVQILEWNDMFNGCENLVDCGLTLDLFTSSNMDKYNRNMFAKCEKIDIEDIKDLIEGLSKRVKLCSIFRGCTSDKIHGASMKLYNSCGIFCGIKCEVLDLSRVEFISDGISLGILDFFLDKTKDEVNKSVYDMRCFNDLRDRVEEVVEHSLIIVNKTMPIHKYDKRLFNVMQAEDLSVEEIIIKHRLAIMLGVKNKTVWVV